MILSKQQALAASKRKFVTIAVPELGGELRLGSLMAGPALNAAKLHERQGKGENVNREIALLILEKSVVDEAGKPFFTAADAEKFIDEVASADTVMLIIQSLPVSGEKPQSIEAVAGNSEASTTGA